MAAVERLPVLHHNVDYVFISFGIIGPLKNGVLLLYRLKGVRGVAKFITACEESMKPRLPFSISNVFFVSKGNLLDFYFS